MTVTMTYALPTRGGVPPSTASTMSLYDVGYSGVMATVNSPEGVTLKKPPMFPSPRLKVATPAEPVSLSWAEKLKRTVAAGVLSSIVIASLQH